MTTRRTSRETGLVSSVTKQLAVLDPYGLRPGDDDWAPANEYEPEARDIAKILIDRGSISAKELDEIWQHWFSEPLSEKIGKPEADAFASRLSNFA